MFKGFFVKMSDITIIVSYNLIIAKNLNDNKVIIVFANFFQQTSSAQPWQIVLANSAQMVRRFHARYTTTNRCMVIVIVPRREHIRGTV